jgi:hypothetical protein
LRRSLPSPDSAEVEACFHTALAVAREQGAHGYDLRAAVSLARLLAEQGRRAEAADVLAPVYRWFTEGFDTPTSAKVRTCTSRTMCSSRRRSAIGVGLVSGQPTLANGRFRREGAIRRAVKDRRLSTQSCPLKRAVSSSATQYRGGRSTRFRFVHPRRGRYEVHQDGSGADLVSNPRRGGGAG